jgi:hypothetical protein
MVPNADESSAEPESADLSSLTGYEDGDHYLIRDEERPAAWLRSDAVRELRR